MDGDDGDGTRLPRKRLASMYKMTAPQHPK